MPIERRTEYIKIGTELAVLVNKVDTIKADVNDIKHKLEADYVTQDQFQPVKNIVFGMVGTILLSVIGAIVALVLRK